MSLVDQAATSTLPKLLQRNAEQDPKGPGIREKSRGVWQTLTWTGYRDQMRDLALGPGRDRLQARRQALRRRRQPARNSTSPSSRRRRWAAFRCRSIRIRSPRSWSMC